MYRVSQRKSHWFICLLNHYGLSDWAQIFTEGRYRLPQYRIKKSAQSDNQYFFGDFLNYCVISPPWPPYFYNRISVIWEKDQILKVWSHSAKNCRTGTWHPSKERAWYPLFDGLTYIFLAIMVDLVQVGLFQHLTRPLPCCFPVFWLVKKICPSLSGIRPALRPISSNFMKIHWFV